MFSSKYEPYHQNSKANSKSDVKITFMNTLNITFRHSTTILRKSNSVLTLIHVLYLADGMRGTHRRSAGPHVGQGVARYHSAALQAA